MGCNQSDNTNEPVNNSTLMRNSSGITNPPGHMNQSGEHSPNNFLISMIGNTSVHGLILGFSGDSFDSIPARSSLPRFSHALLHDAKTGYLTGGIEDL